jgi:hypothetical protein
LGRAADCKYSPEDAKLYINSIDQARPSISCAARTLETITFVNMANTTEYTLEKIAGHHVEETLGNGALIDAKHAADEEHAQTLWQAIKANKKAVGWSVLVSMSVVMEGYDTILIGNFFGYPEFQKKYGKDYGGTAGYQVSAPWQTGLSMASTVGAIFGISPLSSFHSSNGELIMDEFVGAQVEL